VIDRGQFRAGLALLSGVFGREVSVPVLKAYFAILNPRLTTAEFERAVTLSIAQEKFWPSPAVLLAKVEKDTDSAALAALAELSRRLRLNGGYLFFAASESATLDPATRAGIAAAGGLRALAECRPENAAALERRFVRAYAAALDEAPRLTFSEPNQLAMTHILEASHDGH
jgi:hypothetical protein